MHFGLLGPLAVRLGDQDQHVNGLKVRTLLAVLLLEANQPVPVDRLKAALWGDRPPATATASLHNMVARLRALLAAPYGERLLSTPLGYLLRVTEDELDTGLFERSVRRAREALLREDWESVRRESAAALALWRGDPLAELPDLTQAQAPRQQWQEARVQAIEWRIEAELRLGRTAGLVPELTGLTAEHPLHEGFHAQLMLALHRLGQRSEALETYQRLRRALVAELGVEPGAGVRTVHEKVLRGDAEEAAPAAPAAAPAAEPAAPAIVPQAQLPTGITDFTGRQAELRALAELLATPLPAGVPRVAVVSGMGGVGKTALAVHAARHAKHLFPDGQLYADLRGFGSGPARDPQDLLAAFLAALGQSGEHGGPVRSMPEHLDDRAALLRTALADRRVLLVLDNARDAAQVLPLLPGGAGCAVLVTGRHALTDLPATTRVPLEPFDIKDQRAFLATLCGPERVERDPDGALRLLAACAGLPLALRIAGARLVARPSWSLSTLAGLLDDGQGRLDGLAAGHLAVRATFASGYLALRDGTREADREAARAFRLLGLWPGQTIGAGAAAALLERPVARTGELLEQLADSHLLQTPAPFRYRFHDLLGEYAAERAAEEEPAPQRAAARLRLALWYAAALEAASATMTLGIQDPPSLGEAPPAPLPAFRDAEHALRWCVQELPTLKEVIRQSADSARPDLAWRLAGWLQGYSRSYWWTRELDDCLALALRSAEEHGDLVGQAWMLRRIGTTHGMADRTEQAIEALRASLAAFERIGDTRSRAAVTGNLSLAELDPDRSLALAGEALRLHRLTGDELGEAPYQDALARAFRLTGDLAASERHFRRALALWRSHGNNPRTVAGALASLGSTLRGLGRRADAFAALEESLGIREHLGDFAGSADCLVQTGLAHLHFAEWAEARDCFDRAVELGRAYGMPDLVRDAHQGLAELRAAEAAGRAIRPPAGLPAT
ncbi:BTAD domain-containing putative transcriptional regulator [Kitasatospora sp. NPDC058965]|uniref:AfsR/SARP family transcriptional regulator n=1 Tax=Kitasatospora sp. NPDC058965 TaxID=3346682 RepID=UPI00368536B6